MNNDEYPPNFNWRNTLIHYASISNVLAGFCVTFIVLIISRSIVGTDIITTFSQISVFIFGISASLFICAAELFYVQKNMTYMMFHAIILCYTKITIRVRTMIGRKLRKKSTEHCRRNESLGRKFYNSAILAFFIGLFFAVVPYNICIAFIISSLGIILELWQMGFFYEQRKYGV